MRRWPCSCTPRFIRCLLLAYALVLIYACFLQALALNPRNVITRFYLAFVDGLLGSLVTGLVQVGDENHTIYAPEHTAGNIAIKE